MAAAASSSASPLLLPSGPRGASSRAWLPSGGGGGGRAFIRGGNSRVPCCCRAAAGGSAAQCGGADDNGGVVTRRGVVGAVVLGVPSSAFCLQAALDAVAGGLPPEEKPKLCDAACEADLENLPMVTTESGLQYKDIKVGQGPSPPIGFQVAANCIAMVPNGQIFDSSLEKGQPYIFRVGAGQVIKGLDEGILSMKVGGLRRLYIPGQIDKLWMVMFVVHKASISQPDPKPWLEESITIENLKEQLVQHGLDRKDFMYYRSRVKSSDRIMWKFSGTNRFSSSYRRMFNSRCRRRMSSGGWFRLNTGGKMTMAELTNDTTVGKMIEDYKSFQMVDLHFYSRPEGFVQPAPITEVETVK